MRPDRATPSTNDRLPAAAGGLLQADFDEVYDMFKDDVYRFLCHLDPDRAEAEDLFQEVWLRVARHIGEKPDPAGLKPWLFAIAANLYRDTLRKKRVRRLFFLSKARTAGSEPVPAELLSPETENPALLAEQAVLRRRIDQAVAGLPERQRRVFVLQEVEGLKQDEIAGALGIPVGTVKSLMHRAVRRLQKELADCHPGLEKFKCDVKMLSV